MWSNMATSLLLHEHVETTLVKAKELVRVAEHVIADAKNNRRVEVRRVIKDKAVYHKVFDVLAPRYKERDGGFTRILKLGQRKGDAAEVALVKLV
jgi:large subunit ribosomal protein L17